jgi:diketogulonate reductase-like aldo/keto reductase
MLTRRSLLGSSATGVLAWCGASRFATRDAAAASARTVPLPDGTLVPALGQGSWHLGQMRHPAEAEEEAMRVGISLGLTLIDTAEIYGGGRAEEMIGRVVAGQRDRVSIVSKVMPAHADPAGIRRACEASLRRLGTDHLDLYLLHWRGGIGDLSPVVNTFEELRAAGRIRRWGVSNFGVSDMEDLLRVPAGDHCAINQVPYSLADRHIERDLLPWCLQHKLPIMAYSPLGGDGSGLLRNAGLAQLAAAKGAPPSAVALAWTMRSGIAVSIPESGSAEHVRQNAVALSLELSQQDLETLERAFPA